VNPAPVADTGVKKTGPASVTLGDNITYGLTITNTGNTAIPNATMTDELPATTTFVSAGSPCVLLGNGHTISCNGGTLAVGASVGPISFVVKTTAVGTVTNTLTGPSSPTPNDDTSTVTTTVNQAPVLDLGVLKTGPSAVNLGDNITYNLTIKNTGNV